MVRKTNTKQTPVSFDLQLLASWPLAVAIQVCAVAMDVSVTDKIYILSELKCCIPSSLFGADEMSLLANGKENSVLIADTYLYQKMMHNAMCMQDRCETIDLLQNSLADGEDQLVGIRGAVLGSSLFRASESISSLPRMVAGFRLAGIVVVIPSRRTMAFASRLIVAVSLVISPGTSPSVLLLFLTVLLGSLSVSFLAFRSASDVDHERAV